MCKMYELFHKDVKVAELTIDTDYILDTVIKNNKHMPVGCKDESDLASWVSSRGIPATRHGIKRTLGTQSAFITMLENWGLSLSDCYWLRPSGETKTWKDVNFFDNNFMETFSLDSIDKVKFTPSVSVDGIMRKKWIIGDHGVRYLVKGGAKSYGSLQVMSEVIASRMHEAQEANAVRYDLQGVFVNDEEVWGCYCPAFTSDEFEFVCAEDLIKEYGSKYDIEDTYELYIAICEGLGIDVRSSLEYQIMIDFLLSNVDRHMKNLGLLRNTDTLEYTDIAPIFDSGNAMFFRDSYISLDDKLLKIHTSSFDETELDLLRRVRYKDVVDMDKVLSKDAVIRVLRFDRNLSEVKRNRIADAYEIKKRILCDFMEGVDIWSEHYTVK